MTMEQLRRLMSTLPSLEGEDEIMRVHDEIIFAPNIAMVRRILRAAAGYPVRFIEVM